VTPTAAGPGNVLEKGKLCSGRRRVNTVWVTRKNLAKTTETKGGTANFLENPGKEKVSPAGRLGTPGEEGNTNQTYFTRQEWE